MVNNKQVVLLLSHIITRPILKEYVRICNSINSIGTGVFLYHANSNRIPSLLRGHKYYLFTYESLAKLKYSMIGKTLIPGNAHFPLLQFYRNNPEYDYYWVIEHDVRFSGNWRDFFYFFQNIKNDFLACDIRRYEEEPDWVWWSTLRHPDKHISNTDRICSFNPIYRISNSALYFLDQSMRSGWSGHFEVLIPTLLHLNGFKIMDIGGTSSFVLPGMENMFYTIPENNETGAFIEGTMRYRPYYYKAGELVNKLYHPVKQIRFILR